MSLNRRMDTENVVLFTQLEYYLAIKNNEFMKFLGKWMELENTIPSVVTQSQKNHTWCALTDKWILAQKAQNTQDTINKPCGAQKE